MGTILTVDRFLFVACELRVVRWGLVLAILALLSVSGWYGARSYLLTLQVKALKSDNATMSAHIDAQNAAIEKQGKDMADMQKRAQAANQRADALTRKLQQRQNEMAALVLSGDCPDMLQQIVREVRK